MTTHSTTDNLPGQPDIEIYVKRVELTDILDWISQNFDIVERKQAGSAIKLMLNKDGANFPCTIVENATKGGFASIWFESDSTPWHDDEACAAEAWAHFQAEVRCSVSGWLEEDDDTGGWYRFTEKGRSVVNWLT